MVILQFGLFGICDGHGGAAAAKSASKLVFPLQLKCGGKIDLLKPQYIILIFFCSIMSVDISNTFSSPVNIY